MDEVFSKREDKSNELIQGLIDRVNENDSLVADERTTWLRNIETMRDYYMQHVTNSSAYECALNTLAEEIHVAQVKEVKIPLFKNYGIVLHDLMHILESRKSPIDSKMEVDTTDDGVIGKFTFSHR